VALRVAASISLALSAFALLIAGTRSLANLVVLVDPEVLPEPLGIEQFDQPSAVWGFVRAAIVTAAWLAVSCLTATVLALPEGGPPALGRALVTVAGLLFILSSGSVLPGGLTEAAAAAIAMVLGAWCARARVVALRG
jgi:hypothetical protein